MYFFFRLLSRLPLAWVHRLGTAFGWLTYLASPTYRRHLRENMRCAGCAAALTPAAIAEAGQQADRKSVV